MEEGDQESKSNEDNEGEKKGNEDQPPQGPDNDDINDASDDDDDDDDDDSDDTTSSSSSSSDDTSSESEESSEDNGEQSREQNREPDGVQNGEHIGDQNGEYGEQNGNIVDQPMNEEDMDLYNKYQELFQKYQKQNDEFEEENGETDEQDVGNNGRGVKIEFDEVQLGDDEKRGSEHSGNKIHKDKVRKHGINEAQFREDLQMGAIIEDALKGEEMAHDDSDETRDLVKQMKNKMKSQMAADTEGELDSSNTYGNEAENDVIDMSRIKNGPECETNFVSMEDEYSDTEGDRDLSGIQLDPSEEAQYEAALLMGPEIMFDDVQIDEDGDDDGAKIVKQDDDSDEGEKQETAANEKVFKALQDKSLWEKKKLLSPEDKDKLAGEDPPVSMEEVDKAIMESLKNLNVPNIDGMKPLETEDEPVNETRKKLRARGKSSLDSGANMKLLSFSEQDQEIMESFKNKNYKSPGWPPAKPRAPKRFACDICGSAFAKKANLAKHARTHLDEKPFACEVCDAKFTTKSNMQAHLRLHTGEKPYKCDICDAAFSQRGNLTKHHSIHTGEKPYKCYFCEAAFSDRGTMKSHIMLHTGERPFKCDQCKAEFTVENKLIKHQRIHTGERPYKCHICSAGFIHKTSLNKHMQRQIHNGDTPFKCEYCDLELTSAVRLTNHLRTHTEAKRYRCDSCHAEFSMKCSLTIHQRIHTGEKPFKCELCDATFSQRGSLTVHMRIHSGEKPFKCVVCESSFFQRGSLFVHMKLHTAEMESGELDGIFTDYLAQPKQGEPGGPKKRGKRGIYKKTREKLEKLAGVENGELVKGSEDDWESLQEPGEDDNKDGSERKGSDYPELTESDKKELEIRLAKIEESILTVIEDCKAEQELEVFENHLLNIKKEEPVDIFKDTTNETKKKQKRGPRKVKEPKEKKEKSDKPKRKYVKKKDKIDNMIMEYAVKEEYSSIPIENKVDKQDKVPKETQVNKQDKVQKENQVNKQESVPKENQGNDTTPKIVEEVIHKKEVKLIPEDPMNHVRDYPMHVPPVALPSTTEYLSDQTENHKHNFSDNHRIYPQSEFQGNTQHENVHSDYNKTKGINHVEHPTVDFHLPRSEGISYDQGLKRRYDSVDTNNLESSENKFRNFETNHEGFSSKKIKFDENVLPSFQMNVHQSVDNLGAKRVERSADSSWPFYAGNMNRYDTTSTNSYVNRYPPTLDNYGYHAPAPQTSISSTPTSNGDHKRLEAEDYWRFYGGNVPRFDGASTPQGYQTNENPAMYGAAPSWGLYQGQNAPRVDTTTATQRFHAGLNYGISTADNWGYIPGSYPRFDMSTSQRYHSSATSENQLYHPPEFQRYPGSQNHLFSAGQSWDPYATKTPM